jgi:hypothetical protein
LKELSKVVPVTYILAVLASILVGPEFGYVNAQNMMDANTIGVTISNSTSDGDGNGGDENENASNTNSKSDQEENNLGEIAGTPKCLGSALCPD